MNIGDIWFGFRGEGSQLQVDAQKAAAAAGVKGGNSFGSTFKTGVVQGIGQAIGFTSINQAIRQTIGFLQDAQTAYREDQVSVNLLGQALKNNVPAWNGNTDAIERTIKANLDLAFGDEEQRDSLSRLVAVTHDATKAQEMQAAAMDLARYKHVDLATATQTLILASSGNMKGLKQLGIVMKAGATQTEILAAVTRVAGGAAREYAKTDLGKQQAAQLKVSESMEKLGGFISAVSSVALPILAGALIGVLDNMDLIAPVAISIGAALLGHVVVGLVATAGAAIAAAGGLATMLTAAAPFVALGAAVALLYLAFKNNLFGVRDIANNVFGILTLAVKGIVMTFLSVVGRLMGVAKNIPGPWQDAARQVEYQCDKMLASVDMWGVQTEEIVGRHITNIGQLLWGDIPEMADVSEGVYGTMVDAAKSAAADVLAVMGQSLKDEVSAIKARRSALTSAWTDAMDATIRPQEIAAEQSKLIGDMADKDLRKRLASKSATIRAAAAAELADLQMKYFRLQVEDANYGTTAERIAKTSALLTSQALKDGLSSTDEDVRAQWGLVLTETQNSLDTLKGKMDGSAVQAAEKLKAVIAAIAAAAAAIKAGFGGGTTGGGGSSGGGGGSSGGGGGGGSGGKVVAQGITNLGSFDYHNLPTMALGGIVPGAIGQPVPILAHGQERVTPAGGREITINIGSYTGSVDGLAAKLAHHIRLADA